ncbi:MAG: hypothetical protein ACKO0Z_28870 [Betaproteobacteria bacterium]
MSLSSERGGKFTASDIYRLMASSGQADWTPDREGAKGVGYTVWTGGKQYVDTVFQTVAAYDEFVKAERTRLGEFTLSVGAKTYAEEKAMEVLFGEDEYEPQLVTLDIKRGNEREALACDELSMRFDIDLFFVGDNQQFIAWGEDSGATPDGRIGSEDGVTFDVKSPKRASHLSNILTISDNDSLLKACPSYYWQQQCQIAAAEQDYGYWVSYNPTAHNHHARLHVVRIDRNQHDIDRMARRVAMAAEYRNEIINRIRSL